MGIGGRQTMHSVRDSLYARHATADENIRQDELSRRWCASRPNQKESNDFGRDSIFETITARSSLPQNRGAEFATKWMVTIKSERRTGYIARVSRGVSSRSIQKKKRFNSHRIVTVVIQHNSWQGNNSIFRDFIQACDHDLCFSHD